MRKSATELSVGTGATSQASGPGKLDRRAFLERAGLSSAALLLDPGFGNSATKSASGAMPPARANSTEFRPLAPGDIEPEGWLQLYLRKQAEQLASHLPKVSWPFTGAYWDGEEKPPEELTWWPWEQKAYWVDGALRCGLALQDEKLIEGALAAVEYTLNHPDADGYLGPSFARTALPPAPRPVWSNYRWFHTVFFRALAAHADATKDPRVAEAMRRHYLADKQRIDYGGPSRNVTNIEGMLWAYERTGDRHLLTLAETAWNDFTRSAAPGDHQSGDLHPDRVFANTPIHAHGVTYIEKAKLPAILYMHTGNPEYLRFALAAQERIFSHHMLIDGMPSTSEDYSGTTALDAHETCDISDHTWSWGYLLMATGDGIWADRIERACLNAGMGAIKKDWRAIQYFSSPNQVIATHNSNHVPLDGGEDAPWMTYSPNPGHVSACCAGNVHRLFPNYVIRMWMADARNGGIAAMLYGASTVRARVGSNRQLIEVHQETNYPFDEEIHFTVHSAKPVAFPLLLRIPGWCKEPHLALNGRSLQFPSVHKGFVRLERTFLPGDRVTLTLPMQTVLTYWPGDGLGIEHGPLVYALAVKEDWAPVVAPKWSTAEFPEWDARAATAWNYGIGVSETQLVSQAQFERKPMTDDPWAEPPVTFTVPVRKISSWYLNVNPRHPEWKETPPLPEIDDDLASALSKVGIERVSLVPYGATQLRLAIFPKANR